MQGPQCTGCCERDARIVALEAQVAELKTQLEELTQKLKPAPPPRGEPKLPKGPPKKPSGRKPGGQPGHPPHLKELVPPERVNETVPFVPATCERCQAALPEAVGAND